MTRHPFGALMGAIGAAILATATVLPAVAQDGDAAVARPGGDLPGDPAIGLVQVAATAV